MTVSAFDPETLDPLVDPKFYGDYFRITPLEDFATGGTLIRTGTDTGKPDLCRHWATRFLVGGGFSGGSQFAFYSAGHREELSEVATGKVYDQEGNFLRTVSITGGQSMEVDAEHLDLGATAGTIEWTFTEGGVGRISTTYSANGRYSVSLQGECLD